VGKKFLILAILASLVLSLFLSARCGDNKSDEGPRGPADVDTTPPVISSLTVAEVTATTAKITWTTDEKATSQVEYGTTDAYGSSTGLDTELSTSHSVTLENLTQDTEYHFRARSKDEADNESLSRDKDFTTELAQTHFSISNLTISPDEINVWEEATVAATAEVTNMGEVDDTYTAILKVDGTEVQREDFPMATGATEEIAMTFEIMKKAGPSCEIEIGSEAATLTIREGVLVTPCHGDSWTFITHMPVQGYPTMTLDPEITATVDMGQSDESDSYVLELSSEDDLFSKFEGTMLIDKETMLPVMTETTGEVDMGIVYPFEMKATYSYTLPPEERFPLAVGKEFRVEETVTVEGTEYEEPQTTEGTYIYRVETIKDIRVDAGTFRCFEIVKYDDAGTTAMGTAWISSEVKGWWVEVSGNTTAPLWADSELVSYSLSAP
jgi:hypothetical protein